MHCLVWCAAASLAPLGSGCTPRGFKYTNLHASCRYVLCLRCQSVRADSILRPDAHGPVSCNAPSVSCNAPSISGARLWCALGMSTSLVCTFPVPRLAPEMRRPRPIQAMQAARLAEGLPGAVGAGDVVRALRRQQPPRDLLRMQWPRLADLAVQREPPRHNLLHAQPLSPPPGPPPVRDDRTHGAAARWMRRVHERATHAWHACAAWLPADPERTYAGGYA